MYWANSPPSFVSDKQIDDYRIFDIIKELLGKLQYVLGNKPVQFERLKVQIRHDGHKTRCYGRTCFDHSIPYKIIINTDVCKGINQIISTVSHELSHAFSGLQNSHNDIWEQNCGLLMTLFNEVLENRKINRHKILCPSEIGVNITPMDSDCDIFFY